MDVKVFCSMTEEAVLKKYLSKFRVACGRVGQLLDVNLRVLHWSDMAGGLAKNAQDIIDKQAAEQNIYFGMMATKFGRGTEHEYRKAVEGFIKDGSPSFVCFGFCEEKVNPYLLDLSSFQELKQFRADIGTSGKYKRANLHFTFENIQQFENAVDRNLKAGIDLIKGGVIGGPRYRIAPRRTKR